MMSTLVVVTDLLRLDTYSYSEGCDRVKIMLYITSKIFKVSNDG